MWLDDFTAGELGSEKIETGLRCTGKVISVDATPGPLGSIEPLTATLKGLYRPDVFRQRGLTGEMSFPLARA